MKKIFLIFLINLLLINCDPMECGCVSGPIINSKVTLELSDSNDRDLLDPSNPPGIDLNSIKMFHLQAGHLLDTIHSTFAVSQGKDSTYKMEVSLYNDESEDTSYTIIQWNETDYDTIASVFKYETEPWRITLLKAWYNKKEVSLSEPNKITKEF